MLSADCYKMVTNGSDIDCEVIAETIGFRASLSFAELVLAASLSFPTSHDGQERQ